jgi:hypothetical protein
MAEDPGKASVLNLVEAVHTGKYVIPYFQRGYEWHPSMVSDLFESILQDYFAGLILFWGLSDERVENQVWDPVWGAKSNSHPVKAILDGQQRLASLHFAIMNPNKEFPTKKSYYLWFLDLNKLINEEYEDVVFYRYFYHFRSTKQIKQNKDEWIEEGVIPLAILSDQSYLVKGEFEFWLQKHIEVHKERGNIPYGTNALKVSNLIHRILNYEFITTTLDKDRDIHDICNIFARINQKGMRLSTFDLMNAFLYPHGIKLRKRWEALDNEKLKSIDRNMHEYLLKLISLHAQDYCSSKYIYNLIPNEKIKKKSKTGQIEEVVLVSDKQQFDDYWKKSLKYAEIARERIMNVGNNDFGAIKSKFIPNTTVVPVLGAILWEKEQYPDKDINKKLKQWYWSATLSGDYSGSSDSIMSKDFRDWQKYLNNEGEITRILRVDNNFIENELDLFNTDRGAQYNAILCMLALNHAKDFFSNRPLNSGEFVDARIDDHHIFPRKVKGLDPTKTVRFKEYHNSILNRTLLLDDTNKNKISNKLPSDYINEMLVSGVVSSMEELEDLLLGHFISKPALICLLDDDFDGFIIERDKCIKNHIRNLMNIESP